MHISLRTLTARCTFIFVFAFSTALYAEGENETGPAPQPDYDRLKQEIVKEVVEELRNSGMLQEAVRDGIREFIANRQQAQAKARKQQQRQANRRAENVRPVSRERDHVYGNLDAVVSLIEYSDFECPYCKRFHPTAKELVDASDGKVNWVYRHFPLNFHNPGAQNEAEASECAAELGGNDIFWAYTDAIYERTTSNGEGFPPDQVVPLAVELGLDQAAFEECIESNRHEDRVKEDLAEGVRIGISGTPGNVLLNNETGEALIRSGAQPLEALKEAVKTLTASGDDQQS
ncbi:MAG: hypothetical protein MAG794_00998 [Gammaproteobacteria bacterium]|nr:hypothetical protein [Gammaproteobacteria bacterium]